MKGPTVDDIGALGEALDDLEFEAKARGLDFVRVTSLLRRHRQAAPLS